MRHAEAEPGGRARSDFERRLTERGEQSVLRMGRRLLEHVPNRPHIVTSPAARARSTAALIARAWGRAEAGYAENERIYEATAGDLLHIVNGLDDDRQRVLLVGHNPAFAQLATLLSGGSVRDMSTAAAAGFEADCRHWSEVTPANSRLVFFESPSAAP